MAGLRRAELLGLHWDDIDFLPDGQADVHIRRNAAQPGREIIIQEPKTEASKRRVRVGEGTAQALKEPSTSANWKSVSWASHG